MKKMIFAIITIFLIWIALWVVYQNRNNKTSTSLPTPTTQTKVTLSISPSSTATFSLSPTINPKPSMVAPMDNFDSRVTVRWYGKLVQTADSKSLVCGAAFSGYHTGADLEVTAAEINKDVPVHAIADGTVRQIGDVSGYGGLIVIQHNLSGQAVTAYYGHIKLSSSQLKAGEAVTAGQQIAVLGNQCSAETAFERKHLHFAIHKGTAIDVRGYVPTLNELSNWIDPKKYF